MAMVPPTLATAAKRSEASQAKRHVEHLHRYAVPIAGRHVDLVLPLSPLIAEVEVDALGRRVGRAGCPFETTACRGAVRTCTVYRASVDRTVRRARVQHGRR